MMDRISTRPHILATKDVLASPKRYENRRLMILEFDREEHYEAAKKFYQEWKNNLSHLIVGFWIMPEEFEERMRNLFFAIRDRIAAVHGDTSRANKDALYHGLMERADYRTTDGRPILHLSELNRRQLWEMCQLADRILNEEEDWYEFTPFINDYGRELTSGERNYLV